MGRFLVYDAAEASNRVVITAFTATSTFVEAVGYRYLAT
jgi:hypothetical protein